MENLITLVIWGAVLQGLLLGCVFIFSKKHSSFANRLLGFFLLAFVFAALSDLLPYDAILGYPLSGYFSLPEVKMLFPVLFLHFVLEKVGQSNSYSRFLRFHYLLALIIFAITFVNLALFLFANTTLLDLLGWPLLNHIHMGQQYYAFLLTVIVFFVSIKETSKYRTLVKNEFTDMDLLNINWLWQCIFAIAPIILFWGAELFRIIIGGTGQSDLTIVAYIFIAIFIYFVSYKAFTKQTLFDDISSAASIWDNRNERSYHQSKVDPDICASISKAMAQNEYFLDQNLTLHSFAREIQISARAISSCVNQNLGLNFNEWVNGYRVDKALQIMQADSNNQLSIEGIGLDAGFKSRSAMYAAFNKKLGHSPGHFRK